MALVSPGVEVTIIDQSQYLPAASNSVPLLILATAQNKANAAGTGVAPATTKANANKLYLITSQRDLVNLYGNPFFYKTNTNVPIQGYELNEYGLQAAFSMLAASNRCYILRADIDLASLVGTLSRPSGAPADDTYWLDIDSSNWGIYEWNATSQQFVNKQPIIVTEVIDRLGDIPKPNIGNVGDYAVLSYPEDFSIESPIESSTYFYKNADNQWVRLGSLEWLRSIPTVVGSITNPTMTAGDIFTINANNDFVMQVTVPASPNNNVQGVVNAINAYGTDQIVAAVNNGRIEIYSSQPDENSYIQFINQTNDPVNDLGLVNSQSYYQSVVFYGKSSQMPLWGAGQTLPRVSGSVWIKTSATGNGANMLVSKYSESLGSYVSQICEFYPSTVDAISAMDSSGGKAIPEGTLFSRYRYGNQSYSKLQIMTRIATGPTVATGTVSNPAFLNNVTTGVQVSIPGSNALSTKYFVTMPAQGSVTVFDFVTAWTAANIPYTIAQVTTDRKLQLIHTEGGEIFVDFFDGPTSTDLLTSAGFDLSADNLTYGNIYSFSLNVTPTGGSGAGAVFNVTTSALKYFINTTVNAGSGYVVGDILTVPGSVFAANTPDNNCLITVLAVDGSGAIIESCLTQADKARVKYTAALSNWRPLQYIPNEGAPVANPADGTNWFYSGTDQIDILVNQSGQWKGYRNVAYNASGFPTVSGSNQTDVNGPICLASEPATQLDGTPLVYGDLWLDTNDLENFPVIHRWQNVSGINRWVLIDNNDNVSEKGIVFADARWAGASTVDPINDPIPTINSLLVSNYVDLDCVDPDLYPTGTLLFNTRRSSYNVKQFKTNYFIPSKYPEQTELLPSKSYTWVSTSGLRTNGTPYMGRKAQRNVVVQALKSSITTNMAIREEDSFFNLMAAPGYPELQPNMIGLNNERNNTAYIIGDTPMRLADQATDIQNWANNVADAAGTGEDGLVTRDEYMGLFYPSGITNDLSGAQVVVPASHMMLRTFLRNDQIAYPWLAAAGTRRGTIDNATNIGYIDAVSGEFQVIKNRMSLRDVLYLNHINPLAFFTGVGLLNYGNKSSKVTNSAMDRTNVARLVAYIRERLQVLARPFVFEPNDSLTRQQITGVVQSLFIDLVAKRGLYDYLVLCDTSNNTPSRIDRNELWIDVAIEPVKAAEFIYIPVRILNTGALSSQ
jgi:hypothetical protein